LVYIQMRNLGYEL